METTYNPKAIEESIYDSWLKKDFFKLDIDNKDKKGNPYCIVLPPPNVTGSLHMGHGFQNSIMDALIRYHRMLGDNTLWQVGTDHAGIATQMVVERELAKQNISRHDLGREAFLEKVWDWKNQYGDRIVHQLYRMGASADWSRLCFTMDEKLVKVVHKAFIDLYEEGLIYRGKRLVNWDPKFHTAISDLEVISEEENGFLWHIRYPLLNSDKYIVIATTRPETMLGDTAVAVNPNDERYKSLIGKTIKLPITNREIPIIADEYVDIDFGTGCVKITPAHDFNDYEVGKRHNLPIINILTNDCKINDQSPEQYRGLDRFVAREKIVEELQSINLIEKIEPYKIKVPRGDRSKEIIEPLLTDQWFVKIEQLAKPAIEAVRRGDIKFVPDTWEKTYFQWMNNIQDWCISRQLWWGHRIPAWYDNANNIYVGENEEAVRGKYNLSKSVILRQDEDVLDTWFSSALWPFSTLGWPENTPEFNTFYPTSVLVTGFDIIFFWVARMIMMGLKFTGKVPFKQVYFTGLIRDSEGQKMSKSKGNILDPIDLVDGIDLESLVKKRTESLLMPDTAKHIEDQTRKEFPDGIKSFGVDALRFCFCSLANTGRDIKFDIGRLEGHRNFCNKIWNATRYVLMQTQNKSIGTSENDRKYSIADIWITSKLQKMIENVHTYFTQYRFDLLTQTIHEFIWKDYCDWYLELTKPILLDSETSDEMLNGTRFTLLSVLETTLRILHPIMPFVTEKLWQEIKQHLLINEETIMIQQYPISEKNKINESAEQDVEWLQQMIINLRTIRSETNLSPGKHIPLFLSKGTQNDKKRVNDYSLLLSKLARIESIRWIADTSNSASATCLVGELELRIPLEGLIDTNAEIARLTKEIQKLELDLQKSLSKIENPAFSKKAPKSIVDKEKEKIIELKSAIEKFSNQLGMLKKQ